MADTFSKRPKDGSSLPRVRAVSRAVAILRAFSQDRPYLALGEVVQKTGLDAGTVRRLLVTLRDEGLVHQNSASGHYSASTGLLELSRAVPESLTLTGLVEHRIMQLARDTQTTVYLSVEGDGMALCTARHNGGQAIEVRWWAVGEHRAYNRGTGPRVLLAHLDATERERLLEGPLSEDGDVAFLRQELDQILRDGFIVKHDEIASGLSAMAVPLLDQNGKALAAISTGGLTPRYVGAEQVSMLAQMQTAAADMRQMVRGFVSP